MLPDAVAVGALLNNPEVANGQHIAGGILAWALAGGRRMNQGVETTRIHIYGKKWNFAPKGYEAVKFGFWDSRFK